MSQDQPRRPIEVTVHHHTDRCHVVAIETPGRYAPIAACSPQRAEIVQTALALLAEHSPDVLRSLLDALPRAAVPGVEPEIRVTRAAGSMWTVSTPVRESVLASLPLAGERLLDEIRAFAGRAVVEYRDNNGLSARRPVERPENTRPSSPGAVWSQLMVDIDNLTEEQQ